MEEQIYLVQDTVILFNQMMDKLTMSEMRQGASVPWILLDLTMPQFKVLIDVSVNPNISVGQLAKTFHVSLPTMSGIIDRLYEQGIVSRSENVRDRRVTCIATTVKGREMLDTFYHPGHSHLSHILEGLSTEDLQQVHHAFELVDRAVQSEE